MEKMVNIYLYGKKYEVPASLTIMNAMEYAGYQLVRGVGCRCGFCGACATIYRIKGENELKTCLACQTKVEDNMYIATLPFFPLVKQPYDINKVKPDLRVGDACGATRRANAAHHAVKGFLCALFILAALCIGDVLHDLQLLRARLGAGVTANTRVDLGVKLHHDPKGNSNR